MKTSRNMLLLALAVLIGGAAVTIQAQPRQSAKQDPTTGLPVVDVKVTVTKFADLKQTSAVIGHTMVLETTDQKGSVTQARPDFPNDWLHVKHQGAILRFKIASTDGARYLPLGIAFSRHDIWPEPTVPVSVEDAFSRERSAMNAKANAKGRWQDTNVGGRQFPFSGMKIQDDTIQVVNRIPDPTRPPHLKSEKIYKFSIVIRRESDGAIAIVDPFVHNED